MTNRAVDERIIRLAARQHGAFSRAQAIEAGASRSLIGRRLSGGQWARLASLVYGLSAWPPSWRQQCKAAELSITGSAIGGRAGLALREIPGGTQATPDLWVPPGTNRSPLARVHVSDRIRSSVVDGIRVLDVEPAIFDAARQLTPRAIGTALDHSIAGGLTSPERLGARFEEWARGHPPGSGVVRQALDRRLGDWCPPESELERVLLEVLAPIQPPDPVLQASFPWRPRAPQRLDLLVPSWRLIIEGDGRNWHSHLQAFERDRARDNEALAHGYRVLRFTWLMLRADPEHVRTTTLAAAAWLPQPIAS